jgi:hypothetical protein
MRQGNKKYSFQSKPESVKIEIMNCLIDFHRTLKINPVSRTL